ncbi:MAG: ankyrin repeat domain-containing protein [Parachlamydiaceae bacterium]|nr:ankyrin repeat domain-containing protein [Parachlamydiaceae bacterium]
MSSTLNATSSTLQHNQHHIGIENLVDCASKNDTKGIKQILKSKVNANDSTYSGESPLHQAAVNGHAEAMKILIEVGEANLYEREDRTGFTPMNLACSF